MHEDGVGSSMLDEENPHAVGVQECEAAGHVGDEPGLPLAVLTLRDGGVGGGTPGFAPALRPLVEVVPWRYRALVSRCLASGTHPNGCVYEYTK